MKQRNETKGKNRKTGQVNRLLRNERRKSGRKDLFKYIFHRYATM